MLSREHRLTDRNDTARVFRFGKKAYGSLFSVTFLPNGHRVSRFSVIVGKKQFPRAIDRNRIRRLVREALRQEIMHIQPGIDGVFVVLRKSSEKPEFSAVVADIQSILRRMHSLF